MTGAFLEPAEAVDPGFWASQIRRPVRFSDCLSELVAAGSWAFVEVGPGRALSTFVRQHDDASDAPVATTTRHPREERSDVAVALEAVKDVYKRGRHAGIAR